MQELSAAPDPGPATPPWSGLCSGPAVSMINNIQVLIGFVLNSLTIYFRPETVCSHDHNPRPPAAGTRRPSAGSASQQGGA